ncbi:hypothetical protein H0H81_010831 [Sphagnurus paluster]|uniref:Peptidase A1 domain-containing protein n=1 Tax=Sphagnurus paluster TaxID=117069 RepID=A0A9P7KL15_9AGAR|nr:hypothetical protein H0H81_010831 [Sphagnurus paluster]
MNSTGTAVNLLYGDSSTGTFASGVAAHDTAAVAGIAMENQAFGLINSTNNPIVQFEAAGIFGLGFPSGSKVQEARVADEFGPIEETDHFIRATHKDGPLLTRLAMTGELDLPMFSITLQRNKLDIGGEGKLTIGKLPDGVLNSSLTWVPVRLYRAQDGGLRPPTFAPKEVYPFRWEIELDGVFLDGTRIPDSKIPTLDVSPGKITALIDTGNSILRGPRDMVDAIIKQISPSFNPGSPDGPPVPCADPHTLAFQIGGQMFPVDPRDLIGPRSAGDAEACIMDTLVSTDPPRAGSLYRWSLGDTFMKSLVINFLLSTSLS